MTPEQTSINILSWTKDSQPDYKQWQDAVDLLCKAQHDFVMDTRRMRKFYDEGKTVRFCLYDAIEEDEPQQINQPEGSLQEKAEKLYPTFTAGSDYHSNFVKLAEQSAYIRGATEGISKEVAKEIWDAGRRYGLDQGISDILSPITTPDFETFFNSLKK